MGKQDKCFIFNLYFPVQNNGIDETGEEGMGLEFQFGKVKFWRWMVLMVVQQCDVLNATELYILKCLSGTFHVMCISP